MLHSRPITENIESFAGLPVVWFPAELLPVEPAAVAWRVEDEEESAGEGVRHQLVDLARQDWADQVTALVVGNWCDDPVDSAPIEELVEVAPALGSLRALFVGDITREQNEISWIVQGDVTALLSAYPRLETLVVRGSQGLSIQPGRYESLRSLTFESAGLPADVVRAVADCDLLNLTHLELWLGTGTWGGDVTVDDLLPILAGSRLPALRSLGFRNCEIADQVAAVLAGAPVVARLEELDLSLGTLGDDGASALLAGQPLAHLRRLDLHHHFISKPVMERIVAELGAAGVDVIMPEPEEEKEWGRYVAVSE